MAKKLKFGNAVLCEHVVSGPNNKHTLVNVFSGDVIVSAMPASLAFGIYIELSRETSPPAITVEMLLNGKRLAQIVAEFPPEHRGLDMVFALPLIQAKLEKDVTLEICGAAEGFARTTFIKKRIYKGEVP